MSVEHFKEYYDTVCTQYIEMKEEIKSLEEEVSKGLASPDMMDNLRKTIQPLIDNYKTLSCVMYLINKPKRKSKQKVYERQNHKKIADFEKDFGTQKILNENNEVISSIKNVL